MEEARETLAKGVLEVLAEAVKVICVNAFRIDGFPELGRQSNFDLNTTEY